MSVFDVVDRSPGFIQCNNSDWCIAEHQICNFDHDCPDGEDEVGCPCAGWQYDCEVYTQSHDRCISRDMVCNDYSDCADGRDEADCSECPANYSRYLLLFTTDLIECNFQFVLQATGCLNCGLKSLSTDLFTLFITTYL